MSSSYFKVSLVKGFTMVELLVVISIIGILLTILVASFDQSRQQSRDKIRMAELKELQLAVELFKSQNGVYPLAGCNASTWAGPGPVTSTEVPCDNYIDGLTPDFMSVLPQDPNQEYESGKGFFYITNATRSAYKIMVLDSVEKLFITSANDEFSMYPSQCGNAVQTDQYAVYSAGAECW